MLPAYLSRSLLLPNLSLFSSVVPLQWSEGGAADPLHPCGGGEDQASRGDQGEDLLCPLLVRAVRWRGVGIHLERRERTREGREEDWGMKLFLLYTISHSWLELSCLPAIWQPTAPAL